MDHLSFTQVLLEITILYKYYKINFFLKCVLRIALMLDPQDSKNFQILFKALYHTDFIISIQYFLE